MSYVDRIKILTQYGDSHFYPGNKDVGDYFTTTRFRIHEAINTFFKSATFANEVAYRRQPYYKPTGIVLKNLQLHLPEEFTDHNYLFRYYQKKISDINYFTDNWFSFENIFHIRYVNIADPVKGFTDLYDEIMYKSWCTRETYYPTFGELSATGPIECFNEFFEIIRRTERLTTKAPFKVPWFLNSIIQQWFESQMCSIPSERLFVDDYNLGYKNFQLYYMYNYALILAIKFSPICNHMECPRTNLKPGDNPDLFFRCPMFPNNSVFNVNQLF